MEPKDRKHLEQEVKAGQKEPQTVPESPASGNPAGDKVTDPSVPPSGSSATRDRDRKGKRQEGC
jgi:hypothetical protein